MNPEKSQLVVSKQSLGVGRPPPIQAYGAVVKAYTKRRDADAAIDCFYEYQDRGGEPDETLLDMVVTACVRAGEFKRALQVSNSSSHPFSNFPFLLVFPSRTFTVWERKIVLESKAEWKESR